MGKTPKQIIPLQVPKTRKGFYIFKKGISSSVGIRIGFWVSANVMRPMVLVVVFDGVNRNDDLGLGWCLVKGVFGYERGCLEQGAPGKNNNKSRNFKFRKQKPNVAKFGTIAPDYLVRKRNPKIAKLGTVVDNNDLRSRNPNLLRLVGLEQIPRKRNPNFPRTKLR
nr:hypothetical protein [Tanacetum cinerariifolium]